MMAHRKRRNKLWKPSAGKHASEKSHIPKPVEKKFVSSSVQTDAELPKSSRRKAFDFKELESVARITNLPIVESGWNYAEGVYKKIKNSNVLVHWTLESAESSAHSVIQAASPALLMLKGPITSIDQIVCRSLDIVEQTVPSIQLPPEMIYWNTRQYVTEVGTKIAQPVLKRADSVKQIGNTVLASKYTAFAADKLDGALNVAEKYVDKYLPDDNDKSFEESKVIVANDPTGKAYHTMHHADRFSRKLKRRLTQRTIAEVKALKHQSAEAVHVLIYVIELVATDPVLAYQKGKELWGSLSKDEPENQARPENLEQLIVLLTRESARRIVHLINFTSAVVSKVPKKLSVSINCLVRAFWNATDSAVKTIHMEEAQKRITSVLKSQGYLLVLGLKSMNDHLSEYLDHVAEDLGKASGGDNKKAVLAVPQITFQTPKATIRAPSPKATNGVENNL
ncbi:unnamed protein product [Phyllotreta striolata]|uniref:Lipid storage droplets surface-binding protein 1 n=1 Tax=Phyllotreta striolata TaxID=444603 RepID=A0A9N9TWN6_PHYSR|nr:unnamed protein product [Phyllotreta striolata]